MNITLLVTETGITQSDKTLLPVGFSYLVFTFTINKTRRISVLHL